MVLMGLQASGAMTPLKSQSCLLLPPLLSRTGGLDGSTCGHESSALHNGVQKAKVPGVKQETDPLLPVGSAEGRMAWGRHGDAELGSHQLTATLP